MSALDFGCPARRERVYIVGVKVSKDSVDQTQDDYQDPLWVAHFRTAIREMSGIEGARERERAGLSPAAPPLRLRVLP
eukprot:6744030-Pyramimonas_sp.AAC.1